MNNTHKIAPFRKIFIFFLVAGMFLSMFGAGDVSQAHARQGGSTSLSGWFSILRGDSRDGNPAQDIHMLKTGDGRSIQLLLEHSATDPLGGLLALDRKYITVSGDWSDALKAQGGPKAFQVASVAPLAEADKAASAVTGPQKWISILCRFQDNASTPAALSYFQGMYSNTQPGLDHYWQQVSYNLINTMGSTASGWYNLPHPHDFYMSGGRFNLDQAAQDCTGVANSSVNFSTYAGINLMFNSDLDGFAWGGGSYLTLDGVTKVWDMTWEPPWGWQNVAVLGHEMGHALGLPHSSGNYGQTYDNEWDVMSDTWSGCYDRFFSDPVYGCFGQHTISYHKDILGWIPAAQKLTPAWGSTQNVVLEQLALPQTNNYRMVKIPIGGSATHFYTLEARRLTGYDVQLPGEAVIIHEVDTTRYDAPAHVIDIDNNTITGDAGAMWTTGEVFRNNPNKIAVAVLGTTTTGFRVSVTLGLNIYYISGNAGASNVTINYTGGSTVTDAAGRYIFPVAAGWSGTVTPFRAGYTFSPASKSYSNVGADQLAQNFAATSFYTVSGNTGAAGVTLSYALAGTPKAATSDAAGSYSLQVPGGWIGVVTPSHACFTFSPANRGYNNIAANQTGQNYAPTFNSGAGCSDVRTLVGGTERGRFGLAAGASTRASFASVNNGPVKIVSNNNLPLIGAERVIYKVNNVNTSFSEMMGLPNSQVDNTYWLPWYNNVDLDTQLRIANVSGSTASVQIFIGGNEVTTTPISLPVGGSTRVSYAGVNDGPVKIVSSQNIVAAERVIYKINNVNTSFTEMMALPNGQVDNTYWLPWYNNVDLDTQLRIANTGGSAASVRIFIGGAEVTITPIPLSVGESTRVSYSGVNNGPVKIVSDQPIVAAERVIYRINNVNTSFSEMMGLPDSQLSTTYWLPWYNNVDLDTQLRIANAGTTAATVRLYVGGVEKTTGCMPSNSPYTLLPGASLRISCAGVNHGPVKIVSDQPIVAAERVIYRVNGRNTSFTEMMALPSSLLNATFWLPWYNNVDLDTQLRFAVP